MTDPPNRLRLEDLAFTLDGDLDMVSEEGHAAIASLLREDPRLADQLAELRSMAEEVGVERLADAVELYEQLDALVNRDWRHPAEVLAVPPDGAWYDLLIRLAGNLSQRAQDASAILAVREKLEAARAVHRQRDEIYRRCADRLEEVDVDAAERIVRRLTHHVRSRREGREVEEGGIR